MLVNLRVGSRRRAWLVALFVTTALGLVSREGLGAKKAPDFKVKDILTSKTIKLSDYRGKVVIIDFWASWCPPCRMEIPSFVRLQKEYRKKGLVIIGLALDGSEAPARSFAKEQGINYPVGMGNSRLAAKYGGVRSIPTTFVLNQKGEIVKRFIGYQPESTFRKIIEKLLKSGK